MRHVKRFGGFCLWALSVPAALGAEIIVVAPPVVRAGLAPWIEHRKSQGRSVEVIPPKPTAEELRQSIRSHVRPGETKFVLIVGDANRREDLLMEETPGAVPTCYVPAKVNIHWGPELDIATDNPYGDLDDDGLPELAVGRIPAENAFDAGRALAKVIAYERSRDFGDWRRRISFTGCPGNFGPMIDSVIEQGSRKLTTDGIPPAYATLATYGHWRSPYCPDPRRIRELTLGQLNQGGLFWVYIGHGHCRVVDRLRLPNDMQFPIFTIYDVPALACPSGNPIAIFLACYTGAFDFPEDSLSEAMLLSPGGPVAVYSATRVTMPYAMTVMGGEMMKAYFADRSLTLGELVSQAKRQMVDGDRSNASAQSLDTIARMMNELSPDLRAERWEHAQMFVLLGDPSTRLPHPQEIAIEPLGRTMAGGRLTIRCQSPLAGQCRVELVPPRDKLPIRPDSRGRFTDDDATFTRWQQTYEGANNVVLASQTLAVEPGTFTAHVDSPTDFSGQGFVRVFVEGSDGYAVGSAPCEIAPVKPRG